MPGQIMRSHQTLPRDVGVYKMFQGRSSGKGSEAAASRGLAVHVHIFVQNAKKNSIFESFPSISFVQLFISFSSSICFFKFWMCLRFDD